MKVEKIYFDLDDTLADFSLGIKEICGLEPVPQDQASAGQDEAMWEGIRKAGDFYYRLKECEKGMDLFRRLRAIYGEKVEILSAVPKPKRGILTAENDKRRWVSEHLGDEVTVNIVHDAGEKISYVTSAESILIDDLEKNVNAWNQAGGTAFQIQKNQVENILVFC